MPVSKKRRKGKRKAGGKSVAAANAQTAPALIPIPLDGGAMDDAIANLLGRPGAGDLFDDPSIEEDPFYHAQNLMYDAWEAPTKRERLSLARKALKITEYCADAHVLLGDEAAKNLLEAKGHYLTGVAAGEKAVKLQLGADAFDEDAGHFWGILETRPYMRARAKLASVLWALGERIAAIAHVRHMLHLCPNDNLGMRYVLAEWLLATVDHEALEQLIKVYEDDDFAHWSYTKALLAYRRTGPSPAAKEALKAAWESNAFVVKFLTGEIRIPRGTIDVYGPGSKEEAVLYVMESQENWSASEGAIEWLYDTSRNWVPPELTS